MEYNAERPIRGVMRAIIWQIKTDHEGESKITFSLPLSEIASVVQLNTMLEKELELKVSVK